MSQEFFVVAEDQGVKRSTIERGIKQLKAVITLYRETTGGWGSVSRWGRWAVCVGGGVWTGWAVWVGGAVQPVLSLISIHLTVGIF